MSGFDTPASTNDSLDWEDDIETMTHKELLAEIRMVRELAKENYRKAEGAYARGLVDGAATLDHEIPPMPVIGTDPESAKEALKKYRDPEWVLDDILGFLERSHKRETVAYDRTCKDKREGWVGRWSERSLRLRDINNRIHEVGGILGFVRSAISIHRRKE